MFERLTSWMKNSEFAKYSSKLTPLLIQVFFTIICAFISASIAVPMALPFFVDGLAYQPSVGRGKGRSSVKMVRRSNLILDSDISPTSFQKRDALNYRKVGKSIVSRNLFNSEGKVPVEVEAAAEKTEKKVKVFDMSAPCKKPSVSLKLVGTLFLGNARSRAVIKAPNTKQPDHYKEGDFLFDYDGIQIVSIERNSVVFDNKGVKECIAINLGKEASKRSIKKKKSLPSKHSVSVANDFVERELGDGFSKIIERTRMVPAFDGKGQTIGFRVFNIRSALMKKIGFRNGDIITVVNDVSLTDPAKGFELYKSFEEETDVTIKLMRQKRPYTIQLTIE